MFLIIGTAIISLAAFIYSVRKEPRGFAIRNGVIFLGSILTLIGVRLTSNDYTIYLIGVGTIFIGFWILMVHYYYNSKSKENRKNLVLIIAILVAYTLYAKITHWPGTGTAMMLGIMPCGYLVYLIYTKKVISTETLSPIILFGSLSFLNFIFIIYHSCID